MSKIRLLIADDHAVLRAGLRMLLNAQPDMEVVGEAADGVEALEKAKQLLPDVILMDITMPGLSGFDATKAIKRDVPDTKVLALTMHNDISYLRQILLAGASGYVVKKAAGGELTTAIRTVFRGEVYLYPSLAKAVVEEYITDIPEGRKRPEETLNLSDRELEILCLVAQGYTNREIAEQLYISSKTVATHRAHIMEKLNLRSRAELVRYAISKGLLEYPPKVF